MYVVPLRLLPPSYLCCILTSLLSGPGNCFEVTKLLPLLTAASADHPSFHVVALSLAGYGFSEAPREKGFGIPQQASVSAHRH